MTGEQRDEVMRAIEPLRRELKEFGLYEKSKEAEAALDLSRFFFRCLSTNGKAPG
jgi:hypothetical protein